MTTDASATRLTIDLAAIVANWRLLGTIHQGPVAAVLKADGYGTGATQAAPALHAAGCRHFFVAHLAEALAIRPLIPGALLAVLNGPWPGSEPEYLEHGIQPVLGTLEEIETWSTLARKEGRALPALLHIDTGMNRLGLSAAEAATLIAEPERLDGLSLSYVMTHLASADARADPLNAEQSTRFAEFCDRLPPAPRSLANSSGIFLGARFASDLARPGAALYGLNPTPGQPNPMRPVVRLQARILAIRFVAPGDPVGYNATWTASRESRIATLSVGYADGFPRSLSNQGQASFDGTPVPLVGRVSMDLTTFDVTHTQAQPGDWLDLIGPGNTAPGLTADDVAARAGTNGYEILTSLGRRYRRIHLPA